MKCSDMKKLCKDNEIDINIVHIYTSIIPTLTIDILSNYILR